jgi:protein-S-isoprenylcysteine O-methyltransferase Ste14
MSHYARWAQKEHSAGRRIIATLLAGLVFALLLPLVVTDIGPSLDNLLGVPHFRIGIANNIIGGALLVVGLFFAFWTIYAQLTHGRGTPLPIMPTQQLLTSGPFCCCRNPMTLGTFLAYLGIGILMGTTVGIAFVLFLAVVLVLYLKLVEERELTERFGEAYQSYRREVPFIIPRRPRVN